MIVWSVSETGRAAHGYWFCFVDAAYWRILGVEMSSFAATSLIEMEAIQLPKLHKRVRFPSPAPNYKSFP
jgi:hypothetical protein